MARTQLGTDYVLFLNTGTDEAPTWKIALCQTDASLNSEAETIDTTSKCGKSSLLDQGSESIDIEGHLIQKDASDITILTYKEMWDLYKDGISTNDPIGFKLAPKGTTVDDDGKIIFEGKGKITGLPASFPNGDVATASFSIAVDGEMQVTEFEYTT